MHRLLPVVLALLLTAATAPAKYLWDEFPADKAKQLTTKTVQLLQRISEVSFALYAEKFAADTSPLAILVKVDSAPDFVKEAIALVKEGWQETKAGHKIALKFQQKQIAGKPSQLITSDEEKTRQKDRDRKKNSSQEKPHRRSGAVLLTELDSQTVLVCFLRSVHQVEVAVNAFASQSDQSLATNAGLKKKPQRSCRRSAR